MTDAETLHTCCGVVKEDLDIFLDLDLFDAFSQVTEDPEHVKRIAQASQIGHLKIELLLREANQHQTELTRVVLERVHDITSIESRMIDAFKGVLGTSHSTHCFASGPSTRFSLSKCHRQSDPCSTLQQSLREVFTNQDPPTYNTENGQLSHQKKILGGVCNARAGFELAQACLLFLRTTWMRELCRCSIRCGVLPNTGHAQRHQFGFELVKTTHQPHQLRHPVNSDLCIDAPRGHPWCLMENHWHNLIRPIRRLGLLLVEVSLGTAVVPEIEGDPERTGAVRQISILIRVDNHNIGWKRTSLDEALKLIRQSNHDSEQFARAIEYCLTGSFPPSPFDNEMEEELRRFYFIVVKPYVLLI